MRSPDLVLRSAVLAALLGCRPGSVQGDSGETSDSGDTSGTSESAGTDSDETDNGETDDGPMDCGGFSIQPRPYVPQEMMLVVDGSSSMATLWDHDADGSSPMISRWSTVATLIGELAPALESSLDFGLQRFPAADTDACEIAGAPDVAIGPANADAILAGLPVDDTELVGGSPASAAFVAARDHLLAQRSETFRYVLLVTDGGANCGDGLTPPAAFSTADAALLELVSDAHLDLGITTVVVGVDPLGASGQEWPDVDSFTLLNDLALAGGYPANGDQKFLDAADAQQVIDTIDPCVLVSCGGGSCVIDLTTTPEGAPDPAQTVTIESDGVPVPLVEDCAREDGWVWIVEHEILSLCGSWCDAAQDDAPFEGSYSCPPV